VCYFVEAGRRKAVSQASGGRRYNFTARPRGSESLNPSKGYWWTLNELGGLYPPQMTDSEIDRPGDDAQNVRLRLSAQRALLGAVGPSVRAVSVSYMDASIVFQAFVDPEATDLERDALDDAATDVIADFPAGWTLVVTISEEVRDLPVWPELVYLRRGWPG
jgi:hypothetical protein